MQIAENVSHDEIMERRNKYSNISSINSVTLTGMVKNVDRVRPIYIKKDEPPLYLWRCILSVQSKIKTVGKNKFFNSYLPICYYYWEMIENNIQKGDTITVEGEMREILVPRKFVSIKERSSVAKILQTTATDPFVDEVFSTLDVSYIESDFAYDYQAAVDSTFLPPTVPLTSKFIIAAYEIKKEFRTDEKYLNTPFRNDVLLQGNVFLNSSFKKTNNGYKIFFSLQVSRSDANNKSDLIRFVYNTDQTTGEYVLSRLKKGMPVKVFGSVEHVKYDFNVFKDFTDKYNYAFSLATLLEIPVNNNDIINAYKYIEQYKDNLTDDVILNLFRTFSPEKLNELKKYDLEVLKDLFNEPSTELCMGKLAHYLGISEYHEVIQDIFETLGINNLKKEMFKSEVWVKEISFYED